MLKRALTTLAAVALVTAGCGTEGPSSGPAAAPLTPCPTGTTTAKKLANLDCRVTRLENPGATPSPSGSASPTATPTPSPTPTPTATPTPTQPPGTFTCGPVPLGGHCPTSNGYKDTAFSFNSNGYNTYVANQDLGGIGTQTMWANGPRDWKLVSNLTNDGGRVQTFPNSQQLFNDNAATSDGTYPLTSFSALKVTYDETSPGGSNSYQFSPDLFFSNYANDVMFWVDTNGRCNAGAWGPSLLGHFTMPDGSGWTAHRYDGSSITTGNTGAEIILVKDGPGGQGTCAQESSGTIDIKAGLEWLATHGFMPAVPSVYILQTGWEITASSNATFRLNDMRYIATLN